MVLFKKSSVPIAILGYILIYCILGISMTSRSEFIEQFENVNLFSAPISTVFLVGFLVPYFGLMFWVRNFVPRLGLQQGLINFLILGPIIGIYVYHRRVSLYPLIDIFDNSYVNIVLTFLTYTVTRLAQIWGSLGVISILSRYTMFWFGLGGGIWSPLVRFTALFYQPWIQIIPFAFGGIMDVGPIVGLQVHKRVATYFRYLLWCPLPSGILIYDEFENKFSINYQHFENFCQIFFWFLPIPRSTNLTSTYFYLPLPKNCDVFESGFTIPIKNNFVSGFRNYDVISQLTQLSKMTPELLDRYFIDLHPHF